MEIIHAEIFHASMELRLINMERHGVKKIQNLEMFQEVSIIGLYVITVR